MKPVVLVTRKLPQAVEDRLRRDYDPILNPEDRLYSSDEIIRRAADADAILPCHTEKFTADVIARLPQRVRVIANYSVGYDHVDVNAAKARGLIVTNTPDVLSDATAELTLMLMLGGQAVNREEARSRVEEVLHSGKAYEKFVEIARSQKADVSVLEDLSRYPSAKQQHVIKASNPGWVQDIDALCDGFVEFSRVIALLDAEGGGKLFQFLESFCRL